MSVYMAILRAFFLLGLFRVISRTPGTQDSTVIPSKLLNIVPTLLSMSKAEATAL